MSNALPDGRSPEFATKADMAALRADMATLQADVGTLRTDMAKLETRLVDRIGRPSGACSGPRPWPSA